MSRDASWRLAAWVFAAVAAGLLVSALVGCGKRPCAPGEEPQSPYQGGSPAHDQCAPSGPER